VGVKDAHGNSLGGIGLSGQSGLTVAGGVVVGPDHDGANTGREFEGGKIGCPG
jgi:hypothetical protein